MVNSTFHVDTFRQWNPPRTKSLPSHKHLIYSRYPTPPISVANSPSLPKPPHDGASSKLLIPLPINDQQHLLPARPPAEVCVHPNVRSRTPSGSAHRTRENSVSVSCTSQAGNFGYVATPPQAQSHPCFLNLDSHPPVDFQSAANSLIESHFVQDAVADTPSSPSMSSLEEFRLSDEQNAIPIDPVILGDEDSLEASELRQAVYQSCYISPSDQEVAHSYPEPPLVLQITPDYHSSSSERSVDEDRMTHVVDRPHSLNSGTNLICSDGEVQNSHGHKQSKRPSNRTKASEERPPKRLRTATKVHEHEPDSFSALCSHFQSLPFDVRSQFLSWLFEGALLRCMSSSDIATGIVPMTSGLEDRDVPSPRHRTRPHAAPTTSNGDETSGRQMSSRKGMPWSPEEEDLLIKLRRDQRLPWSEVTRLFSQQYSGRSQGSIQVYWSTNLKNRAE